MLQDPPTSRAASALASAATLACAVAIAGCSGTTGPSDTAVGSESSGESSRTNPNKGDIYGEDNRLEYTESQNETLRRVARASAVLVDSSDLSETDSSSVKLSGTSLAETKSICSSQRFSEQPAPGGCSAFLVAPDVMVTAGHCIRSAGDCESTRAVFGFRYDGSSSPVTEVPQGNVYNCASIIAANRNTDETLDYGVIRLDRPVEGIEPVAYRTDGTAPADTPLAVVGYPMGLPVKITAGGTIVDNSAPDSFRYNLDAFGGHSGAAVVDPETGVVEGVHVKGAPDYRWTTVDGESCRRIRKCEEVDTESDNCFGTQGTRSTAIAPHIPDTGRSSTAAENCCTVCISGKACGDECISRSATCARPSGCACDAPVAQPPGSNGGAAGSSCAGTLHCLEQCASDDTACRTDCLAAASTDGRHRLRALASCQERRCGSSDLDSCAESSCPDHYDACSAGGDRSGGGGGTERSQLSCRAIYDCVRDCDDNPCKSSCYDSGTATARSQFDALMDCSRQYGCDDATNPRECLRSNCASQSEQCFE